MQLTLPEPSLDEQAHSQKLCLLIIDEIQANDGFLPFNRFMELALYAPGLGYYMAGTRKFGAEGDFVTAPEISGLFSDCMAAQAAQVLSLLPQGSVLECGAGSGVMAADILLRLDRLDQLPEHYFILELSAELAARQRKTLESRAGHLIDRVRWLDSLEGFFMQGVVLANELLDAMPVMRFLVEQERYFERGVGFIENRFVWQSRETEATAELVEIASQYNHDWPYLYESEFNANLQGWMHSLSGCLEQGAMVLVDYGYTGAEYYAGERNGGTLIGHYHHRALDDPFMYPGLQDLSASVDFSAVARAGTRAGFSSAGYTSQALFLLGLQLDDWYAEALALNPTQALELAQQLKQLTLPSEMGERFQVIGFTKSLDCALAGFGFRDLSHRL